MAGVSGQIQSDGISAGSGQEKLPRAIPEVSVRLDKKIQTIGQSFASRDFLGHLFKSNAQWTLSPDKYIQSIEDSMDIKADEDIEGDGFVPPQILVTSLAGDIADSASSSLISLGRNVILRPFSIDQPTCIEEKNRTRTRSTADQETDKEFRSCKSSDGKATWDQIEWKPVDNHSEAQLSNGGVKENQFIERFIVSHDEPVEKKIRAGFESKFRLQVSQPFAFSYQATKWNDETLKKFASEDNTQWENLEYRHFYPKDVRRSRAIEIHWGGEFILVVRTEGKASVTLYRKREGEWKQLGDSSSLPINSSDPWRKITVYPVSNALIICAGDLDTETYKTSKIYTFPKILKIRSTPITCYMYGAKMQFKFHPIQHASIGHIVSFPVNCGVTNPSVAYTNLSYLGKESLERDDPKGTNILEDWEKSKDDDGNIGRAEFKVKTANTDEKLSWHIGFTRIRHEFNVDGVDSKIKEAIEDSSYKQALETYPPSDNDKNQIEVYYKWIVELKSHDEIKKRIYSPVVDVMEVVVFPNFTDINLNPDPQITHNDVMSVSISDTVTGIGGSVTLWNRLRASVPRKYIHDPVGNIQRGKYTYPYEEIEDPKTNFIGIKPITVRFGISGGTHMVSDELKEYEHPEFEDREADPVEQPIHFRGFIVDRNNSRPNSGSSLVALTLEDISRRAKDHLTFNLPIFDGW